ncbi:hypothetical protein BDN72DRAFT_896331 [Pluteus cervinus]|uniref:Uncharacterized protein n=1 Tax=Pluteus cervinus TaxID=181527 RepID=A0ACD3AYS8_9AGAR|nr:hypothetical protein BDN72DRAFT_896331 [Pluteus cervinus]
MSHDLDTPSPSPRGKRERELEKRDGIAPLPTKRPGPRRSATTGSRPRVGSSQQLAPIPYLGPTPESSSFLAPPALSLTSPTPEASPTAVNPANNSILQHQKAATEGSAPQMQKSSSGGKRKADEAGVEGEITPPKDQHSRSTTFAVGPRPHRASERSSSSHAPSSYYRKRAKLSTESQNRPGSSGRAESSTAANTGSWSSRGSNSNAFTNIVGSPSGSSNHHHSRPSSTTPQQRPASRRSLSQLSLPISALVSPHAPSVSRSSTFHMRDPRKPAPIQSTPWSLSFPVSDGEHRALDFRGWVDRGGSPLHAWFFFVGFVVFPLWWVAAILRVRQTRTIGGGEAEKGAVVLDDPQLEHDAHSWRTRCRIMAGVSLVTYIPFIVLVAIFAR